MFGLQAAEVHRGLVNGDLLGHEGWGLHIGSEGYWKAHWGIMRLKTILEARRTDLQEHLRQLQEQQRRESDEAQQRAIIVERIAQGEALVALHEDLRDLIVRDNRLLARRCRSRVSEAPPPDEMKAEEDTPGESSGYKEEA